MKKLENKFIYIGILIIFVFVIIISFKFPNSNNEKIGNLNLSKYRSEDIPEECRLPEYENNVESWKEHLSHHEETEHCLGYYQKNAM